ncbi:MAG: RsmE family RNA methyltransferase [Treponema sp.]|nr:RsmE family RNA methyltransferase [Treponema sp.]
MNICLFSRDEINKALPKKDERAQHILKILHKNKGDSFSAGIINGMAGSATITDITDTEIHFSFIPETDGKPLYPLILIIGFPRPIQLKRLLRDVAALGASEVHLTGTELGEKSYLNSNLSKPEEAWQMLYDGTVQAASTHVPEVFIHKNLKDCVEAVKKSVENLKNSESQFAEKEKTDTSTCLTNAEMSAAEKSEKPLFLCLDNINPAGSLTSILEKNRASSEPAGAFVAAIGSERGWTENERHFLEEKGFLRCGMGPRVMRTETAATVASSVIASYAGWLD